MSSLIFQMPVWYVPPILPPRRSIELSSNPMLLCPDKALKLFVDEKTIKVLTRDDLEERPIR
jgi:hypothetical protein